MSECRIPRAGLFSLLVLSIGSALGAQTLTVSPKQISFPNQATGQASAPSQVSITNTGASAIGISAIQAAAPFSETTDCGKSLAAGATCTVYVVFTPSAAQYYTGSLTITGTATGSPQTVALAGSGVPPVSFTPAQGGYYFYNQIVSTPSTPQVVTIINNQSMSLEISSIASSADFPFTTTCTIGSQPQNELAAGKSCTVSLEFDPQALGQRTANLTIANNAPGSPIVVPLQGTGIAGSPAAGVNVTPPAPCMMQSQVLQFAYNTTGLSNTSVKWYVDGLLNGSAAVGTISSSGLYTAPTSVGTHVVRAVSVSNDAVSGEAALNVTQTPTFEIYPYSASIPAGGQQTFQAQICMVPDTTGITFTVDGVAGGNATTGTITSAGVYTAPAVAGTHHVLVTNAKIGKTTGSDVTVFSSIVADFGSRTFTSYPVPADMFGTGRGESIPTTSARQLLTSAGLNDTRLNAQIPLVYASETPNWPPIDALMTTLQAAGQHAMLQMVYSPSWLQPTTGPCVAPNEYSAPTNVNEWAQIAAAYVHHMDTTFPDVVTDYEIWNEPNATGMCAGDHLQTYLAIYAAAAPAMKTQAAADGKTIRVGGPVLSGYSALWISNLLTNADTAPYVDFISYHQYMFGLTGLPVQWNTYTGYPSLYQETQDPSVGAWANYDKVQQQVAAGKQPAGAKTPIYVTEFNTNWSYFQDCCRNSATYSPVWNALYATDMLDSVYKGTAKVPDKLIYFAGSAYPWFCMIGVQDKNSDCLYSAGATPVPYPQYYVYDLLASSHYLGLSAGGYMAKSISTPTGGGGLATTAFYTAGQDAIVVTNPTGTAYSHIVVTFANPGFSTTQGTLYTIEDGVSIGSSTVSFSALGTSLSTTIDVPAYSVQAISIK